MNVRQTSFYLILGAAVTLAAFSASANPPDAGSGSIKGTVKLQGPPPPAKPIVMAADPSCAKEHSGPAVAEDVVADANGDLGNVVVYLSDGVAEQNYPEPPQPVVLEQKGCVYQPHVVAMRAGQPLQVVNEDHTTHNIHPMPTSNREWNKSQPPGLKIEETFARPEVSIPVKCNVHPWMRSYIAVFKHPFFSVTSKNGAFDLSNVPPGTYTVQAWHEKFGTSTQKITIGAGESKTVDFVFKSHP